jgi:hypothetical protein
VGPGKGHEILGREITNDRARMLAMAESWLKLADHAEVMPRRYQAMPNYVPAEEAAHRR